MKEETFYCADGKHAVRTLTNSGKAKMPYRREVCAECPWRRDAPRGAFPPDAYQHSARTAYDQALSMFACHMSGERAHVCAGFLLQSAVNNLGVRFAVVNGRYHWDQVRRTVPLYKTYRAMAIANGVDRNDPVLKPCRGNDEQWRPQHRNTGLLDALKELGA